jgi:hypothetical protein
MLDFNSHVKFHENVARHIDLALIAERDQQSSRQYLGASRLGVACARALQYEFVQAPVDLERTLPGRTLRIFEVGHVLEDLAIRWLRIAGFEIYTRRQNGGQFGFAVAKGRVRGHVDGIIANGPAELGMRYPSLFECKTMNDKNWRDCVKRGVALSKPVYATQIAIYQAYMEPAVPGISANPALFTAINKDTQELYFELVPFDAALAQRGSDRAVQILQATDAGELLPRIAHDSSHYECRWCNWQDRCWSKQA